MSDFFRGIIPERLLCPRRPYTVTHAGSTKRTPWVLNKEQSNMKLGGKRGGGLGEKLRGREEGGALDENIIFIYKISNNKWYFLLQKRYSSQLRWGGGLCHLMPLS